MSKVALREFWCLGVKYRPGKYLGTLGPGEGVQKLRYGIFSVYVSNIDRVGTYLGTLSPGDGV